jgi:glycosyltransferase involved in cell wall biosynthesis
MTELFIEAWEEMVGGMGRLLVYSQWQKEVLALNGVMSDQIELVPPGIDIQPVVKVPRPPGRPLRLAFVGRCEEAKGPQVLIDAVMRIPPHLPVEVHLFGVYWDSPLGRHLIHKIEGDTRFTLPKPLAPTEVIPVLADMDFCVVPSTGVEVGPLIVLESFAAGTPIIGSAGYGIGERVVDGLDGRLFPPGDDAVLARLIVSLVGDPDQVARLTEGVRPPRNIGELAADVASCYETLL